MGSVGLTLLKKMKQTIREYLFEGLWGSVGFVEDCGFYSHPRALGVGGGVTYVLEIKKS